MGEVSMSQKTLAPALQRWLTTQALKLLSDGELLERFRKLGDEAAFAALLERHGPMVRGVCARLLRDSHDVDDAVQATFLLLVRQAAAIRQGEAVAAWLHGVAKRTALVALRQAKARQVREKTVRERSGSASGAAEQAELRGCLDEEIGRLPAKYRAPLLLCYVEGRTVDQAASDLAWPRGSVAGRLARAKEMLRSRLTRRGFAVALFAGLETALSADAAAPLAPELMRLVMTVATPSTDAVSSTVVSLATSVERTMYHIRLAKVGVFLGLLTTLGLLGYVASATGRNPSAAPPSQARDQAGAKEWWLHLVKDGKHTAVRPDGQAEQAFSAPYTNGVVAPDGQTWASFVKSPPHLAAGRIEVTTPAGSRAWIVPVTPATSYPLAWSPDGTKLAFVGYKTGVRQVYESAVATGRTTQLTQEAQGAYAPQYHPSGTLAYIVDRQRSGKVMLGDLVLHTNPPQILVSREYLCGYAFSLDGTRMAYSTVDGLAVRDLATQKERLFKVKDVHPDWFVSFLQPYWRPDGKALAVSFGFLGGVMLDNKGNPPAIPGADHLAILPLDGGPITRFPVGQNVRLLGWCDAAGNMPRSSGKTPLPVLQKRPWWLVIHGYPQSWAVRHDGGELRRVQPFSISAAGNVIVSPDGKRQAAAVAEDGRSQIFEEDLATHKRQRLSHPKRHAYHPKYHPDGYIAYLESTDERHPDNAKAALHDLMVTQRGQTWSLVKSQPIHDFAFSPNGRYLAYSTPTEVILRDLQLGSEVKFRRQSLHQDWQAGFHTLLWRPDSQAVAVRLTNLEQLYNAQKLPPVLGDDHVAILQLDGNAFTAKVGRNYDLAQWVEDSKIAKWTKDSGLRK